MKTKEIKPTTIVELDKIDPLTLPELASFKEKSLTVVKENLYIEIIDNPTYELAKKARTNLRSNRTELQKQEKAIKDKLNSFKKKVENVTAELIAITEPHEIKQQTEVTRYEDIKEQERLEKARIEQERVDGIKNRVKSFADLFNSKIQSLTFDGIDDFKAEFDEFVLIQPKEDFQEFEVLYNDMLSHVTYSFSQKKAVLLAQEQNRLEQVRLAEERAENERKSKINNQIQSWFNNWSATIDCLEYYHHSSYFQDFQDQKPLDCQEFQSEYAEKRSLLIQKFESKIALLNQIEDNRIASEKLAKEKAEFKEKQLEVRFSERVKQLTDLGFQFNKPISAYQKGFYYLNIEDIKLANDELWLKELEDAKNSKPYEEIVVNPEPEIEKIEVIEPVVVDEEDFDFNKSYKDAIENLNELTGDSEVMEFDEEDDYFGFVGRIDRYPLPKVISIYLEHHNVTLEDSVIQNLIKLVRVYDLQLNTKKQ